MDPKDFSNEWQRVFNVIENYRVIYNSDDQEAIMEVALEFSEYSEANAVINYIRNL